MQTNEPTFDLTSPLATAWYLTKMGYRCIPTVHGSKAAYTKNWTELRISLSEVKQHWDPARDLGIGLLLGIEVLPGVYPVAIDIDIDDAVMIERIRAAIGGTAPAKRGSKGVTFFVRTEGPMKAKRMRRKDAVTGQNFIAAEILATGEQTVIPPSLHPKGMLYSWIGEPLTDYTPNQLPFMDQYTIAEIELAVKKPDSPLFFINTMMWNGEGGGGDIHNSTLSAIAVMVGMNWPDEAIWARIDSATAAACARAGEPYDWPGWEEKVLKSALDARNKGFADNKKRNPHLDAARWFVDEWRGAGHVRTHIGHVMAYQDGHYSKMIEQDVIHVIASEYPEPPNISFIHSNWQAVARTAFDVAAPFPKAVPSHRRVCFQNGTYDIDANELGPHSLENYLLSQLPFDYDPHAVCPAYDKFINDTFPDDAKSVDTYEEFAAHTLFECLDYQKFLILKGPPNTGKSTLLHLVAKMHSPDATSAVATHQFEQERFRARMTSSLVNLTGEVNTSSYLADDFLKQVTAGDPVDLRILYHEPFTAVLPTRFIFACNEMFKIRDTSGAIERRMIILSCDAIITEADTGLWPKLEDERAGIFNRWVTAWHRLRARGQFDPPEQHLINVAEFSQDQNHVLQWFTECTKQGRALDEPGYTCPDNAEPTEVGVLYHHFREWAEHNGFGHGPNQISSTTFAQRLTTLGARLSIDLKPKRKRLPGDNYVWRRPLTLIFNAEARIS